MPGERLQMMNLEITRLAASLAPRIDVAAASTVPPIHLTSLSRRNVPPAPARCFGRLTCISAHALARHLAWFASVDDRDAALARYLAWFASVDDGGAALARRL